MQSKANAIVITPTLNERENIGQHVHDVFEAVSGISMLVVDDGSRDGTAALDVARRDDDVGGRK